MGTINLDYRSLYHHFECAVYHHCTPVVGCVEQDVQATLKRCVRISRDYVRNDPAIRKITGACLRLIAPLM